MQRQPTKTYLRLWSDPNSYTGHEGYRIEFKSTVFPFHGPLVVKTMKNNLEMSKKRSDDETRRLEMMQKGNVYPRIDQVAKMHRLVMTK